MTRLSRFFLVNQNLQRYKSEQNTLVGGSFQWLESRESHSGEGMTLMIRLFSRFFAYKEFRTEP